MRRILQLQRLEVVVRQTTEPQYFLSTSSYVACSCPIIKTGSVMTVE
jgi:hypothetical protein